MQGRQATLSHAVPAAPTVPPADLTVVPDFSRATQSWAILSHMRCAVPCWRLQQLLQPLQQSPQATAKSSPATPHHAMVNHVKPHQTAPATPGQEPFQPLVQPLKTKAQLLLPRPQVLWAEGELRQPLQELLIPLLLQSINRSPGGLLIPLWEGGAGMPPLPDSLVMVALPPTPISYLRPVTLQVASDHTCKAVWPCPGIFPQLWSWNTIWTNRQTS